MADYKLRPPPMIRSARELAIWALDVGKWLYELYRTLTQNGVLSWPAIDKSRAALSDIANRSHNMLQNVRGLDDTDTGITQDKHVSNVQGKYWSDHVSSATDVHGIGETAYVVGTNTVQTLTNKTIWIPYATTAINLTLSTENIIKVTAAVTITLPTAVGTTGRVYVIDNAHTGNTSVVPTGAETIEGETSQTLYGHACMNVYSDGANWRIK